jgi:hypothetical protein
VQGAPGGFHGGAKTGGGAFGVGGLGDGIGDGNAVGPGAETIGDVGGGLDTAKGDHRDMNGIFDLTHQGQPIAGRFRVEGRTDLHIVRTAALGPRRRRHAAGEGPDKRVAGRPEKLAGIGGLVSVLR